MNNQVPDETARGGALTDSARNRLMRARMVYGLKRVLASTQIAEGTFWRALAGGAIYHGTTLAIEQGLDRLEREAP